MALEGTIKDFGLPDILQMIGIQRKTGVLTLESPDDTVTVKFHEGQVVGADTRKRNLEDLLGAVLVRTGRITESQLQEALRIQKNTLQRLGYILVKSGFVSEEDLRDALSIQVTQIVYRLFRWREGRYHFDPADQVEYDCEHFSPIGAETILMEGARMIDEWPIIERRIRSGDVVFRKTAAGASLEQPVQSIVEADIDLGFRSSAGSTEPDPGEEIHLTPEERAVLRMLDGRTPVQDITERCPLGEFDTYRILYELATRHLIEEVPAESSLGMVAAADWRASRKDRLLTGALLALSAVSLLSLGVNPLTPWRLEARGARTEQLKTSASRAKLERVEQAVQMFYLDMGALPDELEALAMAGYLRPNDLLDPWGRAYLYALAPEGYRIAGLEAHGQPSDQLTVSRRFSRAQRMVLEGPALPGGGGSRRRP